MIPTILLKNKKKYIIGILIKLCKKTNSKQIFYYLNKWADNQIKSKCFSEFNRTFGQWFNFQKKNRKNIKKYLLILVIY